MPDSEVPLDLQRQIEELDDEATTGYSDVAEFVDALPEDHPDECPGCGASLTPSSVFTDADGQAVVVRLACMGTHEGDRVATYIYEVSADELYLESEEEPKTITGDYETDER